MPRKTPNKANDTTIEYSNPVPPAVPQQVNELPDNFAAQYKAAVDKPNFRGRLSAYKPLFCPPGVKLSLIVNPVNENDKVTYREMQMRGWMPLSVTLCTDDQWKAKAENLVCFPFFNDMNGTVSIGPYIVVWKPMKDFMEDYVNDLRRLQASTRDETVNILEDRTETKEAQVVYRES